MLENILLADLSVVRVCVKCLFYVVCPGASCTPGICQTVSMCRFTVDAYD